MWRHIRRGGDVNGTNSEGLSLLHMASAEGLLRAARLLVQEGARVDAPGGGRTPLFHALEHEPRPWWAVARMLMERGAEFRSRLGDIFNISYRSGNMDFFFGMFPADGSGGRRVGPVRLQGWVFKDQLTFPD